jgi:hypothetical protein
MTGDYIKKNPKEFKGSIMMGGGIMFHYISNNNDTGLSEINVPIPSMTIAGDKDGLYRITRNALGYWH